MPKKKTTDLEEGLLGAQSSAKSTNTPTRWPQPDLTHIEGRGVTAAFLTKFTAQLANKRHHETVDAACTYLRAQIAKAKTEVRMLTKVVRQMADDAGTTSRLLPGGSALATTGAATATGIDPNVPVEADPDVGRPTGQQQQFVVCFHGGAVLRKGVEMTSPKTGTVLPAGAKITAIATHTLECGVVRVQCTKGWVSTAAGDGTPLLTAVAAGEDEGARGGKEPAVGAASGKSDMEPEPEPDGGSLNCSLNVVSTTLQRPRFFRVVDGTALAFRRSPDLAARVSEAEGPRRAPAGSIWRAVQQSPGWILTDNELWLPLEYMHPVTQEAIAGRLCQTKRALSLLRLDLQKREDEPYLTARDVHRTVVVAKTASMMCRYVEVPGVCDGVDAATGQPFVGTAQYFFSYSW
jgi:hypothetical protein